MKRSGMHFQPPSIRAKPLGKHTLGAGGKEEGGVSKRHRSRELAKAIAKAALRILLAALLILGTLFPRR